MRTISLPDLGLFYVDDETKDYVEKLGNILLYGSKKGLFIIDEKVFAKEIEKLKNKDILFGDYKMYSNILEIAFKVYAYWEVYTPHTIGEIMAFKVNWGTGDLKDEGNRRPIKSYHIYDGIYKVVGSKPFLFKVDEKRCKTEIIVPFRGTIINARKENNGDFYPNMDYILAM